MRPFKVILLPIGIELALLPSKIVGRWVGGSLLEVLVHAFVDGILLRVAGIGVHRKDSQLDEPHGQPCQASQTGSAAERLTVVGVNELRHAELAKSGLKSGLCGIEGGAVHALNGQNEAATAIHGGQRVAVAGVAQSELALEVGAPNLVGIACNEHGVVCGDVASAHTCLNQAVAFENQLGGGHRGQHLGIHLVRQKTQQL